MSPVAMAQSSSDAAVIC